MNKRASLTFLTSVLSFVLLVAGFLASPALVAAESAPFCVSGQTPEFAFGFADLKAAVGDVMGDALECAHVDRATGDTLQQTSTGLAMYHQATNTPEFTDGWNHWALEPEGVVAWSGASSPVRSSPSAEPGPWGDPDAAAPVSPIVAQQPAPATQSDTPPTRPGTTALPAPSAPDGSQCVDVGGGSCITAEAELVETIGVLSHSSTATPLLKKAATGKYFVHYGDLPTDVLGMFRSEKHDVVISNFLRSFPALDRAPVLAHELTHVSDWMANPDLLQTSNGCLSTEIHAFHNEASVWGDIEAGHLKSPANDIEREFNLITQAIASDPTGFINRLRIVYHDQCFTNQ